MKPKFLAAKLALVVAVSSTLAVTPVQAGIPVIDGTNLSQNIMTAIESVAQTLKQIEQYSTQLQQYHQRQNESGHAHGFHVTLGTGIAADLAPARHYEHQRQQYTTRQQRYIFHLVHFIFLVCVTSPLTASG